MGKLLRSIFCLALWWSVSSSAASANTKRSAAERQPVVNEVSADLKQFYCAKNGWRRTQRNFVALQFRRFKRGRKASLGSNHLSRSRIYEFLEL